MQGLKGRRDTPAAFLFLQQQQQPRNINTVKGDGEMFAFATPDTDTFEPTAAVEWDRARCADKYVAAEHGATSLGDLFFSEQIPEIRTAKAICAGCALQVPCLDGAIERREPWGVWGGQLFQNGVDIAVAVAVARERERPPGCPGGL